MEVKTQLRDALEDALNPVHVIPPPPVNYQTEMKAHGGGYVFVCPFEIMSDETTDLYFFLAPMCACAMSFVSLLISLRQR
jgi:hypothetical protein